MKTLPIPFLRECFRYDPDSGDLVWRHRPRSHFTSERGYRQTNGKYAGKVAGTTSPTTGYIIVNFRGQLYPAHRIIFAMANGGWPEHVDHVDGCRTNNRISNLRSCTRGENQCNRGKQSNNTTGFKGVSRKRGGWVATICKDGKSHWLGSFSTPEQAHAAYKSAALTHHGSFANAG